MKIKMEPILTKDKKISKVEVFYKPPVDIDEDYQTIKHLIEIIKKLNNNYEYHINIYPRTLLKYQEEIKKTKLNNIVFELIENHSTAPMEELINAIKYMSIRVALDDFGNGSSNFDRFLLLPNIDSIKIDRNLWVAEDKITKEIVKLANKKGILTVAEKVETKEELKKVKKVNFDLFQGYYINNLIKF